MRCKIYAPALAAGQFLDASVKAVSADEKHLACACANVPFVPDWLGLKRAYSYFAVDRASKLAVALPLTVPSLNEMAQNRGKLFWSEASGDLVFGPAAGPGAGTARRQVAGTGGGAGLRGSHSAVPSEASGLTV